MSVRCVLYLRLSEGQLVKTVGVPPLGHHDRVSFLGEELTKGSNQFQVGGGGDIVMPTQLRQEPSVRNIIMFHDITSMSVSVTGLNHKE